ncbi:MAG: DUF6868 family protein, partial [Gammaproteobacteria bacterium]
SYRVVSSGLQWLCPMHGTIGGSHKGKPVDLQSLTDFFRWCTLINGALLLFWTLWLLAAPDLVYRLQSKWFPIPRETYNVVMYAFLGAFKIFFIVFNLVPYLALVIVG